MYLLRKNTLRCTLWAFISFFSVNVKKIKSTINRYINTNKIPSIFYSFLRYIFINTSILQSLYKNTVNVQKI